jgi:hypothetical protein
VIKDAKVVTIVCRKVNDPKAFTDNVVGECLMCGDEVVFRPNGPVSPKVCIECVQDHEEDEIELAVDGWFAERGRS